MAWYSALNPANGFEPARARLTERACDGGKPVQDPITFATACPQDGVLVTPDQTDGRLSLENPRGSYRYQRQWYITQDEYRRRQGRGFIPTGLEGPFDVGATIAPPTAAPVPFEAVKGRRNLPGRPAPTVLAPPPLFDPLGPARRATLGGAMARQAWQPGAAAVAEDVAEDEADYTGGVDPSMWMEPAWYAEDRMRYVYVLILAVVAIAVVAASLTAIRRL